MKVTNQPSVKTIYTREPPSYTTLCRGLKGLSNKLRTDLKLNHMKLLFCTFIKQSHISKFIRLTLIYSVVSPCLKGKEKASEHVQAHEDNREHWSTDRTECVGEVGAFIFTFTAYFYRA